MDIVHVGIDILLLIIMQPAVYEVSKIPSGADKISKVGYNHSNLISGSTFLLLKD